MIRKALLTFIFVLATYTFYVAFLAPQWWHASQHQFQDNVIKAQKFLYDENQIQNLIIGSSLAERLLSDSLPNTYNLSFSGQSIFDGLRIMQSHPNLPQRVFIEMNVVLRPENTMFTEAITSPVNYYAKKVIPSLREDRQPLAVSGVASLLVVRKIKSILRLDKQDRKESDHKPNTDNTLLNQMVDLQIKSYSEQPDRKELDQSFYALTNYVNKLENEGVQVTFFEMPVNYRLENLPRAKVIRDTFFKHFATAKYHYIQLPDSSNYLTTDGAHLTEAEAKNYTAYFKSKMPN